MTLKGSLEENKEKTKQSFLNYEFKNRTQKTFHLAGIISTVSTFDHGSELPACLSQIYPNYTLLERSISEAMLAGCRTIWIICQDEEIPLMKKKIGDYVVYNSRKDEENTSTFAPLINNQREKRIPIFWIPIDVKNRQKRDTLGWSILYGAKTIYKTCRQVSKWLQPDKFYVAFPYSVYNDEFVLDYRKKFTDFHREAFVTYKGKTIRDGEMLGFTCSFTQFIQILRTLKDHTTRLRKKALKDGEKIERNPEKNYSLQFIFKDLKLSENNDMIEIDWFHSVEEWDKYVEFLSSGDAKKLNKKKTFNNNPNQPDPDKYRKWKNKIGMELYLGEEQDYVEEFVENKMKEEENG